MAEVIRTRRVDDIINAVALLPAETFWRRDPLQTEPARSLILANEVGVVRVDAPVLLVSGTADIVVAADRARSLHARFGAIGQSAELLMVDGATHEDIVVRTARDVADWIAERFYEYRCS